LPRQTHMKISRANLLLGVICSSPWFLAAYGAESHLGKTSIFLLVALASSACLLVISQSSSSLTKSREIHFLRNHSFLRDFFFYLIVTSYCLFISGVVYLIVQHSFNFAYVRYAYYRSSNSLDMVFYGNKYIAMVFNWFISPLTAIYLLTIKKFSIKDLIVSIVFLASGLAIGGRFNAYRIAIILIINYSLGRRKIGRDINLKNKNFLAGIVSIAILAFFALVLGANRQAYQYAENASFWFLFKEAFKSLYNYHTIQFPVIYTSFNTPMQHGIFTGLLTPFYILSGLRAPEGVLYEHLDQTIYYTEDGSAANAFGTSIMFFLRLADSNVALGIILFFTSFLLFFYVFTKLTSQTEKFVLIKFLLYSFFFSAFQPFMFGFSWWFGVMMIFIYCRSELTREPKKMIDHVSST
jgi:hypothetical protein